MPRSTSTSNPITHVQNQLKSNSNNSAQKIRSFHDPYEYHLGYELIPVRSRYRAQLEREFQQLQAKLPFS